MASKRGQIRYIADGDARNYPQGLTAAMLTSGAIFENTTRITDLTVSGKYDIAFYLNDTTEPIRTLPLKNEELLDNVRVQEWSLSESQAKWDEHEENITIYSLRIDANSLKKFLQWNESLEEAARSFLFIDYVYETM